MPRARVVRDYRAQYANPIRFAEGDVVTLGARDTEWPAFVWTTTADGNAGWAPVDWLKPLGDGRAEALRDYSAQELDVDAGDEVVLHSELGGWWWAEKNQNRLGWVPRESFELLDGEQDCLDEPHQTWTFKREHELGQVSSSNVSARSFHKATWDRP